MKIANRAIGGLEPPFVIAEASCNHNGNINLAVRLIKAAKRAGADAIKFQAYTADSLTIDIKKPDFIIQEGLWRGKTLYELYSKAGTPYEWFPRLFKVAMAEDILMFASAFDYQSVDMLNKLGCPAIKIASFEITDIPLIEYAARTGKPLIISTGLASDAEIIEANKASGGNAAFLRGSSSAQLSNQFIVDLWREALEKEGLPPDGVALVADTSHEVAVAFMQMTSVLDCLIPRGGPSLIAAMREHSRSAMMRSASNRSRNAATSSEPICPSAPVTRMRRMFARPVRTAMLRDVPKAPCGMGDGNGRTPSCPLPRRSHGTPDTRGCRAARRTADRAACGARPLAA